MNPTDPPWYTLPDSPESGRGLRFSCTLCGNCCSGPSGNVHVSPTEVQALAAARGLPVADFLRRYTEGDPEHPSLKERPAPDGEGFDCVFLDRVSVLGKAVCGVYGARPSQCRSWPFWTSVVGSPGAWRRATRKCPGLNKGTLHSPAEILAGLETVGA